MEFLNRIHLRGVVGRAEITTFSNSSRVCNFSIVTEYGGIDKEGNPAPETTWFNVSAWSGKDGMEKEGMADFYGIQRGVWIEVMGRLRMRKYISQSGEERTATEVIARKVALIPKGEDPMQVQRDW